MKKKMKKLIATATILTIIVLVIVSLLSHWLGMEKFNNWSLIITKVTLALGIAFVTFLTTVWVEGEVSRLDPDSLRAVGKSEFFILLGQFVAVFASVLVITI